MRFFIGLHQPSDAKHFEACMVQVGRIRNRKSGFEVGDWMMDSGAFTEVTKHGGYRAGVDEYASQIRRWAGNGRLLAAAAQDFMCEDRALEATGLTLADHQRLTIERYDALLDQNCGGVYVLPVLQGYAPEEYVRHLDAYGERLVPGAWVGVGSVCKRNGDPSAIEAVLLAIRRERPDLQLHGFGLKLTALGSGVVRRALATADSMAWSFDARRAKPKRNANDWREAMAWLRRIEQQQVQWPLFS